VEIGWGDTVLRGLPLRQISSQLLTLPSTAGLAAPNWRFDWISAPESFLRCCDKQPGYGLFSPWRPDLAGRYDGGMSISQTLFDAIQKLEAELQQPEEYGPLLAQEIADLVERMKAVQRKLDQELTEIDKSGD